MNNSNQSKVLGIELDENTRCFHYHSKLDVIAIKFKCCNAYYACIQCHEETTHHEAVVWNTDEFDEKAILCGNCHAEMTIHEYLNANNSCPYCNTGFNPKCSNHHHFYFQTT